MTTATYSLLSSSPTRQWFGIGADPNGLFGLYATGIDKLNPADGSIIWTKAYTPVVWREMHVYGGYIYYVTADNHVGVVNTASWTTTLWPVKSWFGFCHDTTGQMYGCEHGGYIWKLNAGQTITQLTSSTRNWISITEHKGYLVGVEDGGYIYKINYTTGVETKLPDSTYASAWTGIVSDGTQLYASAHGDYIYSVSDTGVTTAVSGDSGVRNWQALGYYNGDIWGAVEGGQVWKLNVVVPTTPTIGTPTSSINSDTNVTLTGTGTIYYTIDGSTPTTASSVYSGAISITKTTTLKAIVVDSSGYSSSVGSATYTYTVATPTSSLAVGSYSSQQTVALSCASNNAEIRYTVDGSTPTGSSTLYSASFKIDGSVNVKAIAIKTGCTSSAVASFQYDRDLAAYSTLASSGNNTYTGLAINSSGLLYGAKATTISTINGTTGVTASWKTTLSGVRSLYYYGTKLYRADYGGYIVSINTSTKSEIILYATVCNWTDIVVIGGVVYGVKDGYVWKVNSTSSLTQVTSTNKTFSAITGHNTSMFMAVTGDGVYSVNTSTGAFTKLASSVGRQWTSMCSDGTYLYGTTSSGYIYRINPSTGADVRIFGDSTTRAWSNIAYFNGVLYATVDGSMVYKLVLNSVASPVASIGTTPINNDISVTLTCAGNTIYYTTDGSTPTIDSTVYSGPISVTKSTSLQCFSTLNTTVVAFYYDYILATPTANVASGTKNTVQNVTLSCASTSAQIRYTTDGSTPTASSSLYSGPFNIEGFATLSVKAFKTGCTDSGSSTYNYVWNIINTLTGNGVVNNATTINISASVAGCVIYYTTDGTNPSNSATRVQYTAPFVVDYPVVNVKTYSTKAGWGCAVVDNAISYVCATPQINWTPSGAVGDGTYTGDQAITVSSVTTGASFFYSADGSAPSIATAGSFSVVGTGSTTVKVIAKKTGYTDSGVPTVTIAFAGATTPVNLTYVLDAKEETLSFASTFSGAVIRYTTDGSDPTTSSTLYSGQLDLSSWPAKSYSPALIKAIAVSSPYPNGSVTISLYAPADPTLSLSEGTPFVDVTKGATSLVSNYVDSDVVDAWVDKDGKFYTLSNTNGVKNITDNTYPVTSLSSTPKFGGMDANGTVYVAYNNGKIYYQNATKNGWLLYRDCKSLQVIGNVNGTYYSSTYGQIIDFVVNPFTVGEFSFKMDGCDIDTLGICGPIHHCVIGGVETYSPYASDIEHTQTTLIDIGSLYTPVGGVGDYYLGAGISATVSYQYTVLYTKNSGSNWNVLPNCNTVGKIQHLYYDEINRCLYVVEANRVIKVTFPLITTMLQKVTITNNDPSDKVTFQYSTDGGTTWVNVVGNTFTIDGNGKNITSVTVRTVKGAHPYSSGTNTPIFVTIKGIYSGDLGGSWKLVTDKWVGQNGVWKPIISMWKEVGGTWTKMI